MYRFSSPSPHFCPYHSTFILNIVCSLSFSRLSSFANSFLPVQCGCWCCISITAAAHSRLFVSICNFFPFFIYFPFFLKNCGSNVCTTTRMCSRYGIGKRKSLSWTAVKKSGGGGGEAAVVVHKKQEEKSVWKKIQKGKEREGIKRRRCGGGWKQTNTHQKV